MRRLLIAFATLCLGAGTASAGDYADRTIIGFSPDGAYFAFEEYGVQDGSGFPYSNIYVIDTRIDSWVEGTPIRVRIDDETAELTSVRSSAYDQAGAILRQYDIGEIPGIRVLVSNPITELGDHRNVEFLIRAFTPLQTTGWQLALTEHPLPTECPDLGLTIVGFDLDLTAPDGAVRQLNHDTRVPESRNCPVGYGVSDIIAYDGTNGTVVVILLNMFTIGFEGPDRRFLAIATTIAE
jgi:predicted secreted protein